MRRYDQCDEHCTVDCGHCKGNGPPAATDHDLIAEAEALRNAIESALFDAIRPKRTVTDGVKFAAYHSAVVLPVVGAAPSRVTADNEALDGAMHSVWLHGQWRWLTTQMTTPQREAAWAAVRRFHVTIDDDEPLSDESAWWRPGVAQDGADHG